MPDREEGDFEYGPNEPFQALCWSSDSSKLASGKRDEIVIYDVHTQTPLRILRSHQLPQYRAFMQLCGHGRSGFGYTDVLGRGVYMNFYCTVDNEEVLQSGVDREYDGIEFTTTLAEFANGNVRVVSKHCESLLNRKVIGDRCVICIVANAPRPRLLCLIGIGADDESWRFAIQEVEGRPGLVRVAVVHLQSQEIVRLCEFDECDPGAPFDPETDPVMGRPMTDSTRDWLRAHTPKCARLVGELKGHAHPIKDMAMEEGGRRLVTYDREHVRVWDLDAIDPSDLAGGDDRLQGGPPAAGVGVAPLPIASPGGAVLVASLRDDGVVSCLRCGDGPANAKATISSLFGDKTVSGASTREDVMADSDSTSRIAKSTLGPKILRGARHVAVALLTKGGTSVFATVSDRGELKLAEVRVDLEAGAPRLGDAAELSVPIPSPVTAFALGPGAGTVADSANLFEAYFGLQDGGIHAFVLQFGAGRAPRVVCRRASWFHGGPVACLATRAAEGRMFIASAAYDGTELLATLGPELGAAAVTALDRLAVTPWDWEVDPEESRLEYLRPPFGSSLAVAVGVAAASGGTPPVACTGGKEICLYVADAGGAYRKAVLAGHAQPVTALDFTGRATLVSAARDGSVLVWDCSRPRSAAGPLRRLELLHTADVDVLALDGANRVAVCCVNRGSCEGDAKLEVVRLEVEEPEGGAAARPLLAEGEGWEATDSGRLQKLSYEGLARDFVECFTVEVGEREFARRESEWDVPASERVFPFMPPTEYSATVEMSVASRLGDVDVRVSGVFVEPNRYSADQEHFNTSISKDDQAKMRSGSKWEEVELRPFRLLKRCQLRAHFGLPSFGYGIGVVTLRPSESVIFGGAAARQLQEGAPCLAPAADFGRAFPAVEGPSACADAEALVASAKGGAD
eukprot:tig00020675_g12609.t1